MSVHLAFKSSDGERNLVGLRSPSDWIASTVCMDCVRNLIGRRSVNDDRTKGNRV